ncbi:MAG: hypothetical protein ACI915_001451 [Gammaproteobacteria bacterium]|jgi:hypothetical protein
MSVVFVSFLSWFGRGPFEAHSRPGVSFHGVSEQRQLSTHHILELPGLNSKGSRQLYGRSIISPGVSQDSAIVKQ